MSERKNKNIIKKKKKGGFLYHSFGAWKSKIRQLHCLGLWWEPLAHGATWQKCRRGKGCMWKRPSTWSGLILQQSSLPRTHLDPTRTTLISSEGGTHKEGLNLLKAPLPLNITALGRKLPAHEPFGDALKPYADSERYRLSPCFLEGWH